MEFKVQEFVDSPSVDAIQRCTKEHLFAIAEYYCVEVSKHAKKPVVVHELCEALLDKGLLPAPRLAAEQSLQSVGESVRLKELEVELQRLSSREKELQFANELEMKKLEVRMRVLELGSVGRVAEFDVAKYIRLVPPFNEEDVDKYFCAF